MKVFLVGMMGSGKSTVGRRLAGILGMEFVDMDEEIEKRKGKRVREIFEEEGERTFRELEKRLLRELLAKDNVVVATGGGVVLDRENRELLKKEKTIFLYAPPSVLLERVDVRNRPLLKDGKERIYEIWEKRKAFYEEFERVDTTNLNEWETCAVVVLKVLEEREVLNLKEPHPLSVVVGGFKRVKKEELVFTTWRVEKIFEGFLPERRIAFPDGEEVKTLEWVAKAYSALVEMDFPRGKTIAGVGGGALTDFTGFVASTFKRGTGLSFYPTTLLAQVDASVGGKNAIDFAGVKNVVGTFRMPDDVLIDPAVTVSMDQGRFEEGVVEALKMVVISGRGVELFDDVRKITQERNLEVLTELVRLSVEEKARVVREDPHDKGFRHVLNLGHTLGHVFEMLTGVSHGLAVAWGLEREAFFSWKRGLTSKEVYDWILEKVLQIAPGLVGERIDREQAKKLILNDKKIATSKVRFPYPRRMGEVDFLEVDPLELLEVVA